MCDKRVRDSKRAHADCFHILWTISTRLWCASARSSRSFASIVFVCAGWNSKTITPAVPYSWVATAFRMEMLLCAVLCCATVISCSLWWWCDGDAVFTVAYAQWLSETATLSIWSDWIKHASARWAHLTRAYTVRWDSNDRREKIAELAVLRIKGHCSVLMQCVFVFEHFKCKHKEP